LQRRIIPLFHYSLNPGGILFLGSAETVGAFSNLFGPLDGKTRLFRRLEMAVGAPAIEFPFSFVSGSASGRAVGAGEHRAELPAAPANLQTLADHVIAQHFSPAALLTNDKGDLLYISGRTGKYLEPAVGKANLNVFAMAREGLRYDLSGAFATALREERPVTVRSVKVGTNGGTQTVDLTVQKLAEPKELRGTVMIFIADVAAGPEAEERGGRRRPSTARLGELLKELREAREEVQTTREEMQTSQEELKSTNEELQSTNEELQSTNEELTTSKEEMQSMNEELQTVNHELEFKVDELSRSNNDMKNLLNSTDIATLFLDGELCVRRFTTPTTKLIKLIPGDAGRPITDIASNLDYSSLADDAREVLRTLVFTERQVAAKDGRWYTVRILPYRTLENTIDGVVITFSDATAAKQIEMREQASQQRQMAESLSSIVWGARPDGACDYLSQQWAEYTGVPTAEQLGYGWLEQLHPEDRERARGGWRAALKSETPLSSELRIRDRSGVFRWFKTRLVPIRDEKGVIVKWYGTFTDVDDLRQAADRLAGILEGITDAFFALDDRLTLTYINAAAERVLERPRQDVLDRSFFEAFPEAAGSLVEEKFREGARERGALLFRAQFERGAQQPWYDIRVYPHAHGISVLFQSTGEPAQAPPVPQGGEERRA
ncbi:MAG: PAS domain-containing protein, partial [Deltaproteobacteria bacterium]|nr:PAS domain-containing protein [Deltaproteobacteria bacterium]